MNELSGSQQEALIECLAALEAGADIEACLARWPEHTESLRPLLEFRAQLLASDVPTPPPAAFQAGREALLEQVAAKPASSAGWLPMRFRWARLSSPVAQVAAAAAVLVLLAGGALGASAGAGFEPARDVLSALPVIDLSSRNDEPAGGPAVTSPTQVRGDTTAGPGSDDVTGPRPEEIRGVGLCFAEGELPDGAVPSELLVRVPEAGLCIPEGLLQRSEDGRACVPKGIAQQLAGIFDDQLGDLPVCSSPDAGQPPNEGGPQPTMVPPGDGPGGPPATVPPGDGPGGPPATMPPPSGPQGPPPTEDRGEQQGPSDGAPQGPSDGSSGPTDGASQGPSDGAPQEPPEGAQQGPSDGAPQEPPEEAQQGPSDGAPQEPPEGAQQGPSDGAPQGPSEGGPPAPPTQPAPPSGGNR